MNNGSHEVTTGSPTPMGLRPRSLEEAIRFAEMISRSSIVPKDYQNNEGNCLVAMQWGAELGLAPLQAMQNIAVINGRPAVYGDAMLSLVRASGLLVSIEEVQTEQEASCVIQRKGEAPVTKVFSVADAKRAGLWGKAGPWTMYPKRMLQMRARAFALRDVFPDVLKGIHIVEEVQDLPADGTVQRTDSKSTAASVKAKLASRSLAAEVLHRIEGAQSMEALKAAGEEAALLSDGPQKDQARDAYMKKALFLKHQTVVQDVSDLDEADDVLDEAHEEDTASPLSSMNGHPLKTPPSRPRDSLF